MGPEIRNFAEIERFIKERPKEADALVFKWQEFAKQNPDTLPTDSDTLLGKDIQEAYFYLRDQDEERQMQTQGSVNSSALPASLAALTLPVLALVYRERPKLMEDDKDYQKLVGQHKKLWLEKNPGKDFTGKEGLDYLHGSLEDENAPTLKKDAEQAFRNNPKYRKRVERYDNEAKKIYKNPEDDPRIIRTREEIETHIKARNEYLKTHEEDKKPEEISQTIQKKSWERFVEKHPEKAKAYSKINTEIKKAHEKQEIKKQLADIEQKTGKQVRYVEKTHRPQGVAVEEATRRLESITPSPPATIPQAAGRRFGPPGRRVASGIGRFGTRLITQAGVAVGRTVVAGLVSNPIGWVVIGVIVAIIIIVFLIIMFSGGGGIGGGAVPAVDCADADGKPIVVFDGNQCAENTAAYYSKLTGTAITATCADKCTDTVKVLCNRNAINTCTSPDASCGTMETFCIQYSPPPLPSATWLYDCNSAIFDYTFFASCSGSGIITPTPTPSLLGTAEKSFVLLHSSANQSGILKEPEEGVKLSVEEILEAETDSGWVYVAKTIPDLNNVTFWFGITKIQNNVGLVYGIADIKNNNYYSGLLPGGEIEAGKFGDNYGIIYYDFDKGVKYKAAEVKQIDALGTIELNVNLPWPSPIDPKQKYVYSNTLPLTGYPIWESGDGVIPLNSSTLSWYLSFVFENGVWMDIQKFNAKALATFGPRAANHRWGAFILEKPGGGLPADTIGVWWEILDENNNPQPGGFTNFDMKKGPLRFTFLQDHSEDFKIIPIETYSSGNKVYLRKWKFVDTSLGVDLLMETNIANQENQVLGNYFYEGGIKVFDPGGTEIGTGMYEATHSE